MTRFECLDLIDKVFLGEVAFDGLTELEKIEIREFTVAQKEQLCKKNEAAKVKAAKKHSEGDALRQIIFNLLTEEYQTTFEILDKIVDREDVTAAKVSARLNQLIKLGLAIKKEATLEGRKLMTYARVVATEEV